MESPCALDGDTDCSLLGLDKEKHVSYGLNWARNECSVWILGGMTPSAVASARFVLEVVGWNSLSIAVTLTL